MQYKLHTREQLIYNYQGVENFIMAKLKPFLVIVGQKLITRACVVFVVFDMSTLNKTHLIESDRELTIDVKFCKCQEMRKMKLTQVLWRGRRDRMVVGFTTTKVIRAYYH